METKSDGSKVYNLEDFKKMSVEQANDLLMRATKIEGKVLVRKSDGTPKYADPSLAGTYGEDE